MAIERVLAGQSPTLLHADKANELIDAVNSLKAMTISPTTAGKVVHSDGNTVIQITAGGGGGGEGEWEEWTVWHLGAPGKQNVRVEGPAAPI